MAYIKWQLSSQLQVLFSAFVICLTGIIMVLISIDLNWLESQISTQSSSVLDDIKLNHMKLLAKSEANFISNILNSAVILVKYSENLSLLAFDKIPEITQPFEEFPPLWAEDSQVNYIYYNTSMYMGRYSKPLKDSIAYDVSNNISRLNWIFPSLYYPEYLIYQAFYADELINWYPGLYSSDYIYHSPLKKDWFRRAAMNSSGLIITEPYLEENKLDFKISFSKAIKFTDDEVLGVTAVDLKVNTLKKYIESNFNTKEFYSLLISKAGMVLSSPKSWDIDGVVKIYNQTKTGIGWETWAKIVNSTEGEKLETKDLNGSDILMITTHIICDDFNETSHYLLLVSETSTVLDSKNYLEDNFAQIKTIIFWTMLAWCIIVLIVALILIYLQSQKITANFSFVNHIFVKIIRRAAFVGICNSVKFNKIDRYRDDIEDLVQSVKAKVKDVHTKEKHFQFYKWVNTRPSDVDNYSLWANDIYPFNQHYETNMPWRDAVDVLEDIYYDIE